MVLGNADPSKVEYPGKIIRNKKFEVFFNQSPRVERSMTFNFPVANVSDMRQKASRPRMKRKRTSTPLNKYLSWLNKSEYVWVGGKANKSDRSNSDFVQTEDWILRVDHSSPRQDSSRLYWNKCTFDWEALNLCVLENRKWSPVAAWCLVEIRAGELVLVKPLYKRLTLVTSATIIEHFLDFIQIAFIERGLLKFLCIKRPSYLFSLQIFKNKFCQPVGSLVFLSSTTSISSSLMFDPGSLLFLTYISPTSSQETAKYTTNDRCKKSWKKYSTSTIASTNFLSATFSSARRCSGSRTLRALMEFELLTTELFIMQLRSRKPRKTRTPSGMRSLCGKAKSSPKHQSNEKYRLENCHGKTAANITLICVISRIVGVFTLLLGSSIHDKFEYFFVIKDDKTEVILNLDEMENFVKFTTDLVRAMPGDFRSPRRIQLNEHTLLNYVYSPTTENKAKAFGCVYISQQRFNRGWQDNDITESQRCCLIYVFIGCGGRRREEANEKGTVRTVHAVVLEHNISWLPSSHRTSHHRYRSHAPEAARSKPMRSEREKCSVRQHLQVPSLLPSAVYKYA
ncbi:hypothetical protein B566_EDAN017665 [Ephemera danica]|nr:hypothetical protein B566_EDAN017665 [Ephemera danica]